MVELMPEEFVLVEVVQGRLKCYRFRRQRKGSRNCKGNRSLKMEKTAKRGE